MPAALTRVLVVLVAILATPTLVAAGGRAELLEMLAVPAAVVLIGVFRLLGPTAEHVGWAVYLAYVGLAYTAPEIAGDQLPRELAAAGAIAVVASLGVFVSPWWVAIGYALHVPWDFVPRALPDPLGGLPVACLLFDGTVGAYAAWQARSRRWVALRLRRGRGLRTT